MPTSGILSLRMRLRPDLIIRPQQVGSRRSWIVKDPITLRYFTFGAEEYSILESLDGTKHLNELCETFEQSFAPKRMTTSRLAHFLGDLYLNGLLISDEEMQGAALLEHGSKRLREERLKRWLNVLAIRFRGLNPEGMLRWLYHKVAWCFSPIAAVCYAVIVLAAVLLISTQVDILRKQLPTMSEFISVKNVIWLSMALAITKVVHELSHALVCKHFGGNCHEMGIMFLIFTPCLYCNVTDSWLMQDRRHRIAISAAGIAAEVLLASLAIFCWWLTPPGILHAIAIDIILVCGIGTVLFNGNPLLRYDGYFILSDLLDIPNLWQKSRSILRRQITRWFIDNPTDSIFDQSDRPKTLITYAICSIAYQVFITITVFFTLFHRMVDARLDVVAYFITASVIVALALSWAPSIKQRLTNPMLLRRIRWVRVSIGVALSVVGVIVAFVVPFRCSILSPALIQIAHAQYMYVATEGRLVAAVKEGTEVQAGQVVARLENIEIDQRVAELTGEHEKLVARIKHLEVRATTDADADAELVVAREMCADIEKQLAQEQNEQQRLILRAPKNGTVIAPAAKLPPNDDDSKRLSTWYGTPLDAQNINCFLQRGALVCVIGDPKELEAVAFVNESDIQYIRKNEFVRLRFEVGRGQVMNGQVAEIAEGDMQFVPAELSWERDLAGRKTDAGNQRPLETSYQVRIKLNQSSEAGLIIGSRGYAKIEIDPQSLADRLVRKLSRVFDAKIWNPIEKGR